MATVRLLLNDVESPLEETADLVQHSRGNANLVLRLLGGALDGPVSAFAGHQAADILIAEDAEWDVGGDDAVTLGVKGGVSGLFAVRNAGEKVLSYRLGQNEREGRDVVVPVGHSCISIGFQVSLRVSGGMEFSSGNLGVSAEAGKDRCYKLINHKMVSASMPLGTAIRLAFDSFCLPFKPEGFDDRLGDGDHVEYEFSGKLLLGFGATYGVTRFLLAGRSASEIRQTFDSKIGKAVFTLKPSVKAGASFSVEYTHTNDFRVVVGRKKSADENVVTLSLFRRDESGTGVDFEAGVTVSAGASVQIEDKLEDVFEEAGNGLFGGLSGPLRTAAVEGFKRAMGSATNSRQRDLFVQDVNEKIKDFLTPTTQKAAFIAGLQRVTRETALFNFEFDFSRPSAKAGFKLAVGGNYVGALGQEGVTLLPESFVEDQFVRRTSIGVQLFDLFRVDNITEYFRKSTLKYVGDGVFRFFFKTGLKDEVKWLGKSRSAEVYFVADANTTTEAKSFSDIRVLLKFGTRDVNNPKSALETAHALQAISLDLTDAARSIQNAVANSRRLTVEVECTFQPDAFGRIQSDDIVNKKPRPLVEQVNDRRNWRAFTNAVNRIPSQTFGTEGFPNVADDYAGWALYNLVANGWPGSRAPNRLHSGNLNTRSLWPEAWSHVTGQSRNAIVAYLEAGRLFMNFCDGVKRLAGDLRPQQSDEEFGCLLDTLSGIVKNSVDKFFIKSVMVALFEASRSEPVHIQVLEITEGHLKIEFEATALSST